MGKQNMYLRVVPELKEKLQAIADKQVQSINALIIQALWELVNKQTSE